MRITCPLCGPRDRREFYYSGSDDYLNRPAEGAAPEAWDDYLHLRDNPAGITRDLWYHESGCASWLVITRNTVTHEIHEVALVADRAAAPPAPSKRRAKA
jgi:heterotetrameric sarcosine oxidase delta subunit